jgi:hypothetical protein
MSAEAILARGRRFLLWLAAALCAGTVVELWLTSHTETPVQLVPFVVCAAGMIALAAALLRPSRGTILALRAAMVIAALAGLFGAFQHVSNNLAFAIETNAARASAAPIAAALTGANPPLAPGVLGAAAAVALAATYAHPALRNAPEAA